MLEKDKKKETKKVSVKKTRILKYSSDAYCNIIGATDAIRYVANMKFKKSGRKTIQEWKENFKKQGLI